MKHTDIVKILKNSSEYIDTQVTVCGWVRTARDSKNIAFIELNDGTCLSNLQLIVDKENSSLAEALKNAMAVGTSLKVVGKLVASERNGCEVLVE